MKENLREYFNNIEHLGYDDRLPIHTSLFENKAMVSKLLWDIHSYNAKKFYKTNNNDHSSTLEKYGYITGELNEKDSKLLKEIFSSCKKITLDPFDFDYDYVHEPRKNLHENMDRINNYYKPSKFFFDNLPLIFNPLKELIEKENQFYWKVASCRIFEVKPVKKTQGYHKDDQALAIKKFFFYPNGANKKVGSTTIIDKNGKEVVIELKPGSWLLFENSLCEHQACSSEDCVGRPTIEIDIMPDFSTDTTLNYHGVNGWYPWFPILDSKFKINNQLDYQDIYDRNLKRISGLCKINESVAYKFPCEFSDYYDDNSEVFISKKLDKTENNIETDINNVINKYSFFIFLIKMIKIIPVVFVKKIIRIIKK